MYRHFWHKRVAIYLGVIVIAITVTVAILFFKHRPMINPMNYPYISSLSITIKEDGEIRTLDIPGSEISDELADNLVSVFLNTEIRNRLFPPPQTYEILDGSTHITVKVGLKNAKALSIFVNLCSRPQYNSAQFGDTHYHIVDYQKVYENVYCLLSDEIL